VKAWRPVAGALLIVLVLWPTLPVRAQGPLYVWVDDDFCGLCSNDGYRWGVDAFATISAGLTAVAPGGTVYVRPGRYQEDVRVAKPCKVLAAGPGGAVLTPRVGDVAITVAANDVTIQGLEIVDAKKAGVLVLGPSFQRQPIRGVVVRQNVIRGGHFGVAVNIDSHFGVSLLPIETPQIGTRIISPWRFGILPATAVEISNNTISQCRRAIYTHDTRAEISGNSISGLVEQGIGIFSSQGSVSTIRVNTVNVNVPNGRAIFILKNEGTVVEGNTLVGATELLTPTIALALYGYTDLTVHNNSIHGFYYGLTAYTGGSARITGNTFDSAIGWALSVGTAITSTTVTIADNVIRGSYLGLRLDDDGAYGLQASVQGNAFHDNVTGIHLAASIRGEQVQIHANTICGNLVAGLRNESAEAVVASDNWWGANDGPRPAGSGDRAEGPGGVLVEPWLRLQASTQPQPDGRVTVTARLANGRVQLQDHTLVFTTDRGAFVETNSASRTALTDRFGEVQATLYPLAGEMANVTISGGCGRPLTFGVPTFSGWRVETPATVRPGR
jgi:nitrous oxidase accessory protein NosD